MDPARRIVQIDEVKPSRSRKGRRGTLLGILVVFVLVAGAATAFLLVGTKHLITVSGYEVAEVRKGDLTVTASVSGTVVLPQTISVTAPQTGYADRLFVKAGDTVKVGTLLATLSVPDLEDDRQDYLAQLAVAKIAYDDLANDWDYTIRTSRTALARAEETILKDQKDLDTKKALSTLKSTLKTEYETALETLKTAVQNRDDLAAALENNLKKKVLILAKQQATIDQLQTSLNRTEAEIEGARIKSPLAGEVLSIDSVLSVPKSLVTQYDVLIKVADRTSTDIDLEVNESDAGNLSLGDKLTLTVSAKTLVASITSIGKVASLSSDGLTATVTVRVTPVQAVQLTPGASAAATITLGTKKDALTLPRGAFLTTGAQKYVYRVEGSVARKTAVTFGSLQANTVEVKSGLRASDRVLVSGYQDFIDQDIVQLDSK